MAFHINSNTSTAISRQHANSAIQGTQKSIERLSTGKKIVSPSDNAAGLAISGKLNGKINNFIKFKGNLQNSLSFLQIQGSIIEEAGKMINRASELKHHFHDIIKNQSDKANYDEEFKEIQLQLRELQQQKFNGISLFANGNIGSLASASNHNSILEVEHLDRTKSMDIHRTGIFDSGFAGDRFTISQGTDTLLDEVYGKPLIGNPNITFGDGYVGNASTNDHRFNKDPATGGPISFPITNNPTDELTFYVNKGGQTAVATNWETDINITYKSTQMSLTDGRIYSLNDFEFSEFSGFIDVISNALAQNGASQARINYETDSVESSQINLASAHGRIEDADVAKESLRLAKYNILSQTSANMIGKSNQLTNLAIEIMGL